MRLPVGLAAAAVTLLLLASPAVAAGVVGVSDPRGDGVGPGDLRGLRVSQVNDVLRLRIRTQRPLNQAVAPTWHRAGSKTFLRFVIDSRANTPGADWVILLRPGAEDIVATLRPRGQSAPRDGCIPSLVVQTDLHFLQVAIGSGCFQGPFVRVAARYRLDQGGNGTVESNDRVPNSGYARKLVLER